MEFVEVKDMFGESGEPDELSEKYQIDKSGLPSAVKASR